MVAFPFCDWLGWLCVFPASLDPSQGREGTRELFTQWWSCLGCCPKCWQIKHAKTAKTHLGPGPHSVNPPYGDPGQQHLPSCTASWAMPCRGMNPWASCFCLWDPTCPISGQQLMRTSMMSFSGDSNDSFARSQRHKAKRFVPVARLSVLWLPEKVRGSGRNTESPAVLSASCLCCCDTNT